MRKKLSGVYAGMTKQIVLTEWIPLSEYNKHDLYRYEKNRTPYHYANSIAAIWRTKDGYSGTISKKGSIIPNKSFSHSFKDSDINLLRLKIDMKLFELGYSLENLFI